MGGPSAIQAFLTETYAVDVSPDFISTVTDAIVAEVTAWQSRPLEPLYPVVFCDARRVTSRDDAVVRSKAVSLAVAVLPDGSRDMLGIWIEPGLRTPHRTRFPTAPTRIIVFDWKEEQN